MRNILQSIVTAVGLVAMTIAQETREFLCRHGMRFDDSLMKYNDYYCADLTGKVPQKCNFITERKPWIPHCSRYNVDLGSDNPQGLLNRCKKCKQEY